MKVFGLFFVAFLAMLVSAEEEEEGRYWVQYKDGSRSACLDTMTSFEARSMPPVKIHGEFADSSAFVVTATKEEIMQLSKDRAVKLVVKDNKYYPQHIPESIEYRQLQDNTEEVPYGIKMVQALEAHNMGYKGNGAKVCVLDTGLDAKHEDFITTNLFGDDDERLNWRTDEIGHGTHCTGTIAAASNGLGVVGVAPEAEIFTIRVFSEGGAFAYGSTILSAIEKCVENGANIVSMSLGGPLPNIFEYAAYGRIVEEKDVLLVAAAGNGGNGWWSYPASYPNVLSVAAIDENMKVADFSQSNRRVDIAAPGVRVLSTFPTGGCTICSQVGAVDRPYGVISGTSMACPHVAGVAALLRGAFPALTALEIADVLTGTAKKLGSGSGDRNNSYGHGLVQAVNALKFLNGEGTDEDGNDEDEMEGEEEDPWWCFWCD